MKRKIMTLCIIMLCWCVAFSKTVYFDNSTSNWSKVYCYAWDSNDKNKAWPGEEMEEGEDNLWRYDSGTSYPNVIFNNGSSTQTVDLSWSSDNLLFKITTQSGNQWNASSSSFTGTFVPKDTTPVRVFWDNSTKNWDTPYIYYWGTSSPSYPGVSMTLYEGTVWYYDLPQGTTGILFNAGDGDPTKTDNMTVVENHLYNQNGDQGEYSEKTIYWDNSTKNWNPPYIHYWGGTSSSTYPGVAMTLLEGDIWQYVVAPGTAGILFNAGDGDATKTDDFTPVSGNLYNQDGDQGEYTGGGSGGGGSSDRPCTNPEVSPTGTLPILHINLYTTDAEGNPVYNDEIIDYNLSDKDYRKGADYWIEIPQDCHSSFTTDMAVGSEETPLKLDIKARGNFTRVGFSKKPFKLKLGVAQNLLGMNKAGAASKHWAILAHADDDCGYLRNFVGFNLGERIGLPWTPRQRPVEVVINGDYRGIYFLTESIRVEPGRMEGEELNDSETDPALLSGSYLVELDNYEEADNPSQISMTEKTQTPQHNTSDPLRVTPDTPEVYSSAQKRFVTEQFSKMNDIIGEASYNNTDELWKYMDLDDAVRYYLVMEVISHWEAYHGSTYLMRDRGEGRKWHFSPLWDCGNAFNGSSSDYLYNCDTYGNTWIPSIVKNQMFDARLKETWKWFMANEYEGLMTDIDAYVETVTQAASRDHSRWNGVPRPVKITESEPRDVVDNTDMASRKTTVKNHLNAKISWLSNQWGSYASGTFNEPERDTTEAAPLPDYVKEGYVEPERYIYVYNDGNWGNIYIYLYYNSTPYVKWPGTQITYDAEKTVTANGKDYKGVYTFKVPFEYIDNGLVIFNNGSGTQYPGANQPGLSFDGDKIFFTSNNNFVEAALKTPYSGTLPVVFVNTTDNAEIGYEDAGMVTATYYISVPTGSPYAAIGASDNQLVTEIKGRGETFSTTLKPTYKLKFDAKASPLGMNSSKHFLLASYCDGGILDYNALIDNWLGHEISRKLGMKWTPAMQPVELMINGTYKGLYMLVENIRPASTRVAVNDTDSKKYDPTDDWIVRFSSSASASDVRYSWNETYPGFSYTMNQKVTSYHPEYTDTNIPVTTAELDEALADHFDLLRQAVDFASTNPLNTEWTDIIDSEEIAKYYVVQELMDDPTAFTTDLFLWHTVGSKWNFGPVYNFKNAFASSVNSFDPSASSSKNALIHKVDSFDGAFIAKLYENRYFQFYAMSNFLKFYNGNSASTPASSPMRRAAATYEPEIAGTFADIVSTDGTLDTFTSSIQKAAEADSQLWNDANSDQYSLSPTERGYLLKEALKANAAFLNEGTGADWKDAVTGVDSVVVDTESEGPVEYFDLMGRRVAEPAKGSVYIRRQGSRVVRVMP